jgi:hypothetical protein
MKNVVVAAVALSVLLLFTSGAHAQTWYSGYPQTGPSTGQIAVRATMTLPSGISTTGSVIVQAWPVGGGVMIQANDLIRDGQTGAIDTGVQYIGGLTSGQNYNVTVIIQGTDGTNTYNYETDPATATAK